MMEEGTYLVIEGVQEESALFLELLAGRLDAGVHGLYIRLEGLVVGHDPAIVLRSKASSWK
jgi:hypothetical protein